VHISCHPDFSKSWLLGDGTRVLHRGDVPILGLHHFVHAHILREESDYTISMLYEGGSKALWFDPT
jgi:hypothetical protein